MKKAQDTGAIQNTNIKKRNPAIIPILNPVGNVRSDEDHPQGIDVLFISLLFLKFVLKV